MIIRYSFGFGQIGLALRLSSESRVFHIEELTGPFDGIEVEVLPSNTRKVKIVQFAGL